MHNENRLFLTKVNGDLAGTSYALNVGKVGMTRQYSPGMQMYEALWRSDGERIAVFYMHAANEAVVLAEAKTFLKEYPEFLHPIGHLTLSIRALSSAERLRGHQSTRKTSTSPFAVEPRRFRSKHRAARCNA